MIKPFKNAYEAIKKLLASFKKNKKEVGPTPEELQKIEAEKRAAEEAARAAELAKHEEEEKQRILEAKAKAAEEKAKKNAGGKKGSKGQNQKKNVAATIAAGEAAEQKKYEEEVKKRAERAAKREQEDQKEESGKKIVDPVNGEDMELLPLPDEAVFLQKYLKIATTSEDILVAFNSIQKHPDMPKNIVVLGRNGFGTTKVGEDFARSFFATGLIKSDKIAKIKAKQLNKIGLEKLEGLKGGCLIIENAGLVAPAKLVEVIKNSAPDENDYVVMLTGEIDSLAGFFEDNQEIVDSFIYLIDIHKIRERGMISIARGYFKEKEVKADKAIFERLKNSLKTMETGNIDRFIELLDGIIDKCKARGGDEVLAEDFQ
ncbi:MAG: hypothetical protein K6E28_09120 [Eubacterium sp.]|nr:hypothetical protein [Eubacterium sp.]